MGFREVYPFRCYGTFSWDSWNFPLQNTVKKQENKKEGECNAAGGLQIMHSPVVGISHY